MGVNNHRLEINHDLVFKRLKNIGDRPSVIKCPKCGANMDVNKSGRCDYCGSNITRFSKNMVLTDKKMISQS